MKSTENVKTTVKAFPATRTQARRKSFLVARYSNLLSAFFQGHNFLSSALFTSFNIRKRSTEVNANWKNNISSRVLSHYIQEKKKLTYYKK